MSSETISRRLAAIVSIDVAGYSKLIALDEVGTVRRLTEYRALIARLAQSHGGRVVDNPGDNALLEFPSATSAVESSAAIQGEIRRLNAGTDRPMEVRIGIHLGEVLVEDERIYGDGVNVAARLEAIAPVGEICVSSSVKDQVDTKTDLRFEDMGEHELKNISQPIHAFRVGEKTRRAITSAGVANLTQLLERDAAGTLSALKAHRTASDPIVLSHGGRVIEADQNRILYEFPSALEAVKCAAEVQALMAGRNATIPTERRMHYKLGIHEGLDAEAVDTAVRIQERSQPGGVSLSEPIYQEVASQLGLDFVEVGSAADGPRVWQVESHDADPEQPSILSGPGTLLVLPFERLGNDPDQDYLVDGITDDLIAAISEYGGIRVVPRSSAFAYRDSTMSDRDIARRLDATYIVKGSLRSADSRVRVSVELVEAETGELVLSERFDREYKDVLDLQDEMASTIAYKLAPAVEKQEVERGLRDRESFESWNLLQRAKWHYYQATREDFDTAVELCEKAITTDASNPRLYPWLCLVLITRIWHGWSPGVGDDLERVRTLATEGIRLDPDNWRSHDTLAAYLMLQTRDFDRAVAEAEYGEKYEPGTLGAALQRSGDHERSIEMLMRDLQINPNRPDRYHWTTVLAGSQYMMGNYEAALAWAERSLELNPRYIQAVGYKAASLAQLGRIEEARAEMDRFLEHFSGMTAARYKKRFNFKNEADVDHYMDGLVKAGMPPGDDASDVHTRAVWLAVLPFDNIGADQEQEYFADGISEDVITGLSAYRSMRVIARSSSFRYRGSDLSIPAIADELGVQYVLEGSVRKSGDKVRVTAQLIEAPDRHHIWADRYDSDLEDIFEAQDRITASIVAAIDPAIRSDHVTRPHPGDLRAWDHLQRAWHLLWKAKSDSHLLAIDHFRQAIEIDPEYPEAHAGLGTALSFGVWLLWSDDPASDLEIAERHAKRAVQLDDRDALGHEALAMVAYAKGRMESTIKEADRAIQLNPSRAVAHMLAGAGRIHGGDPESGIPLMTKAIEISPQDPFNTWFIGGRAIGHLLAGHYEDAVVDAREAIKTRYGYLMGRVILTVALVQLGRADDASKELASLLEIDPEFGPDYLARYTLTEEQRQMFESSLAAAGSDG